MTTYAYKSFLFSFCFEPHFASLYSINSFNVRTLHSVICLNRPPTGYRQIVVDRSFPLIPNSSNDGLVECSSDLSLAHRFLSIRRLLFDASMPRRYVTFNDLLEPRTGPIRSRSPPTHSSPTRHTLLPHGDLVEVSHESVSSRQTSQQFVSTPAVRELDLSLAEISSVDGLRLMVIGVRAEVREGDGRGRRQGAHSSVP